MVKLIKHLKESGYSISTDQNKLQIKVIHGFLTRSYWAKGISLDLVRKAVRNSFGFGIYFNNQQIGFARVITDYTVFAHLADVFVLEDFRGKGLSKWLIFEIMNYSGLQNLRKWTLATEDAHKLYEKFGFTNIQNVNMYMEKLNKEAY